MNPIKFLQKRLHTFYNQQKLKNINENINNNNKIYKHNKRRNQVNPDLNLLRPSKKIQKFFNFSLIFLIFLSNKRIFF